MMKPVSKAVGAVGAIWLGLSAATATGCASSKAGNATTTSASIATDAQLRRLEALQSRNPEWTVVLDGGGRVVATTRWASLMRSDIRAEVDALMGPDADSFGIREPGMKRVVDEPTHVRWEKRETQNGSSIVDYVDASLRDGVIHVIGSAPSR